MGLRLAPQLGMYVSPTTLLRCLRTVSPPVVETVHVLGLDDWGATRSYMCSCKDSRKEAFTWVLPSVPCQATYSSKLIRAWCALCSTSISHFFLVLRGDKHACLCIGLIISYLTASPLVGRCILMPGRNLAHRRISSKTVGCCKKSEENCESVKSHFPVQLR